MLSRVTRGRIVQRFAQSIFASTRGGVSQASRTVRIISVLPNAVMSFQMAPTVQSRVLTVTPTVNKTQLLKKQDTVQSVELIDVFLKRFIEFQDYTKRSLDENLQVLTACGHYSPGMILAKKHPLFAQVDAFIQYLDSICVEQFSKEVTIDNYHFKQNVNPKTIVDGLWAISRLGYSPSTSAPMNLVNLLLSKSMVGIC